MIWSWPKWIGRDQNKSVMTKMNWSGPNCDFCIRDQNHHWKLGYYNAICWNYHGLFNKILVKFPSCCSKSKIEPYFLITAQKSHARNISCSNLRHYTTDEIKQKNTEHIQTILYPKQIVLIFILLVQDTAIIHIFTKVCTIENGYEINIFFAFLKHNS